MALSSLPPQPDETRDTWVTPWVPLLSTNTAHVVSSPHGTQPPSSRPSSCSLPHLPIAICTDTSFILMPLSAISVQRFSEIQGGGEGHPVLQHLSSLSCR